MAWSDPAGSHHGELWHHRDRWMCADAEHGSRPLAFRLLAAEPLAVPEPEPSEAVISALARLVRATQGSGALVMLDAPAATFAMDRLHGAEGVRLFGIGTEPDVAAWDGLLALGQPVYGVRGRLTVDVLRPHPASILSALAYGLFTADEGLLPDGLREDRTGITYQVDRPTTASVVIRHGYEAAILRGAADQPVTWRDQGNELVVRLVISDGRGGTCWTQPRFVAAAAKSHAG